MKLRLVGVLWSALEWRTGGRMVRRGETPRLHFFKLPDEEQSKHTLLHLFSAVCHWSSAETICFVTPSRRPACVCSYSHSPTLLLIFVYIYLTFSIIKSKV